MWSMGVISYMVYVPLTNISFRYPFFSDRFRLGGYAPFEHKVQAELNRLICNGKFEFHSPEWDEVGPVARVRLPPFFPSWPWIYR